MAAVRRRADEHRMLLAATVVLAGLVVLFYPYLEPYTFLFHDAEAVRDFIQGFGVFAPLALISLQVLQVLVAPIPGQVLGIAAGYAFGPFWGTVYATIGVALGSLFAIALAARYGRPLVERLVSEKQLDRFDGLTVTYGFTPFFLLFLLPGFPDDTVCLLAGLTPLDKKRMVIYATVGRIPGIIALTITGNSLAIADVETFLLLVAVVAIVSAVSVMERDRILAYAKRRRERREEG